MKQRDGSRTDRNVMFVGRPLSMKLMLCNILQQNQELSGLNILRSRGQACSGALGLSSLVRELAVQPLAGPRQGKWTPGQGVAKCGVVDAGRLGSGRRGSSGAGCQVVDG